MNLAVKYDFEERESEALKEIGELLDKKCKSYKIQSEQQLIYEKRLFVVALGENVYNQIVIAAPGQWEKNKERLLSDLDRTKYGEIEKTSLGQLEEDKKELFLKMGEKKYYDTVGKILKHLTIDGKELVSKLGEETYNKIIMNEPGDWEKDKEEWIRKLGEEKYNAVLKGKLETYIEAKEMLLSALGKVEYDKVVKNMLQYLLNDREKLILKLGEVRCERIIRGVQSILDNAGEKEIKEYKDHIIARNVQKKFVRYLEETSRQNSDKEKTGSQESAKLGNNNIALIALLKKSKEESKKRFEKFMTVHQSEAEKSFEQFAAVVKEEYNGIQKKVSDIYQNGTESESGLKQFMDIMEKEYFRIAAYFLSDAMMETEIEFIWFWILNVDLIDAEIEGKNKKKLEDIPVKNLTGECAEICRTYFNKLLDDARKWKSEKVLPVRRSFGEEIKTEYSQLYQMLEFEEEELFLQLIYEWKKEAEKEREGGFKEVKQVLLCESKNVGDIKNNVIKTLQRQFANWRWTEILQTYLDFLCQEIFKDEDFWGQVYKESEELKQDYCDYSLKMKMERESSALLEVGDKKALAEILGCNFDDIEWVCPEISQDIFKDNFDKYSYYRCFWKTYNEFYGLEYRAENSLRIRGQESQFKISMEDQIGYIFLEWISDINIDCFRQSMLKELLHIIIEETTIRKSELTIVYYSEDEGYWIENNKKKIKLWNIPKKQKKPNKNGVCKYRMKKHYSYAYQIKVPDYFKGRSMRFSALVNNSLEAMKISDYFESYIFEMEKQTYTAWKVYSLVYEFLQADKENDELLSSIEKLTESIKSIYCLELRLFVLEKLRPIFNTMREDRHAKAESSIEEIAEIIQKKAESINKLYDKMYFSLLWLFRKESNWKNLLWLKNRKTDSFSSLLEEICDLKGAVEAKGRSYCEMKFWKLYTLKPTNPPYPAYNKILRWLRPAKEEKNEKTE